MKTFHFILNNHLKQQIDNNKGELSRAAYINGCIEKSISELHLIRRQLQQADKRPYSISPKEQSLISVGCKKNQAELWVDLIDDIYSSIQLISERFNINKSRLVRILIVEGMK